ncbi:MAG: N-acetylneuraminate synthase family protein [Gammaproteobacteria bacterium]
MASPYFQSGRCLIVAEVAQAHDGSLGTAHAFIDVAADCGADAIKFQTHFASEESTAREPWRVRFSKQDDSRYDYWRRMEFEPEHWRGLKQHADERGIQFLSSPFSEKAVELLDDLGMPAWKIASGELHNPFVMEPVLATGKPVILSSGMSPWSDLDRVVNQVRDSGVEFGVLQCTTAYPCPPERVGLNVMAQMRERYGCPVGLSDHSAQVYSGLAAVTQGAQFLEVHLTLSPGAFGPDVPASLTPEQLADLVRGARFIETMNANPVDKDAIASDFDQLRFTFGRGLVARDAMEAGTVLRRDLLAAKKPADGIPAERLNEVLGKKLTRSLVADEPIGDNDLIEADR